MPYTQIVLPLMSAGINTLRFESTYLAAGAAAYALDDIVIQKATVVPEPRSGALLAAGMLVTIWLAGRRKHLAWRRN